MKYPVFAKVEIYEEREVRTESVVLYAESFADAAAQLEEYYDTALSIIRHLELFESGLIILENEETAKAVYKEMNWMCNSDDQNLG